MTIQQEYRTVRQYVYRSLCAIYETEEFVFGSHQEPSCSHLWCHGALDVLNRVSSRMLQQHLATY
ncbi:hypothetical protein LCGC14_1088680 [marine sediment metagenome]|uniref:Uncharacterized protein n=1 Tax=marine sediment metagenome TaxID=412755 RepID=A0A0F9MDB0_9ZZZZ